MSSLSNNHEKSLVKDVLSVEQSWKIVFTSLHYPWHFYPLNSLSPCIFSSPHFFYSCIFSILAFFLSLQFVSTDFFLAQHFFYSFIFLFFHFLFLHFFYSFIFSILAFFLFLHFFYSCIFSILAFFLSLQFVSPAFFHSLHLFIPAFFLFLHFFYPCIFLSTAFFLSEYILIVLWLHFSILAFFNFYPWNLYPCNYIPAFFIFLQFLSLCFAYIHFSSSSSCTACGSLFPVGLWGKILFQNYYLQIQNMYFGCYTHTNTPTEGEREGDELIFQYKVECRNEIPFMFKYN